MSPNPLAEKLEHEIPAFAPMDPTRMTLFLAGAATVFGKSSGTRTGRPIRVSLVGWKDRLTTSRA